MESNQGLVPGTILHGAYRIERILGQGGFGITYLAYEAALDRYVAIKEFFPRDYCDREATTSQVTLGTQSTKNIVEKLKAKFLREARNIVKFDHPGIIKIYTAFEENHTAYYVMDYIEGQNLSELVKKRIEEKKGPLPEYEALRYIRLVGEALDYVHSQSINHFDVKPANILIRKSDDRPILIDFGLSKQYEADSPYTATTTMGMSHGYSPMEQYVMGGIKEFSPQTDLYSLAATLYYILSGIVPPQAPLLVDQELTFPPSIPVSLIKPISKAMSSSRGRRHESVGKFLEDLNMVDAEDITCMAEEGIEDPRLPEVPENYECTYENDDNESDSKGKRNWIWMTALGILFVVGIVFAASMCSHSGEKDSDWIGSDSIDTVATLLEDEVPVEGQQPDIHEDVVDLIWVSPLGKSVYTGSVLTSGVTGEQIPDGKGIARIIGGIYDGCTYDGEFVKGVMEGKTKYTYKNGDTFEGTFVENKYNKGKYTINSSGEYFEGTYKDGNPDIGNWYDSDGNKLE